MESPIFPPIPASTVRSARSIYGRGNPYLYLGDRLDTVLSKIEPKILRMKLHGDSFAFLALLTIIQVAEDLTDYALVESVQRRPDLKYALHLPDPSIKLSPVPLCVFRRKVLSDPSYREMFEKMFKQIYPKLNPRKQNEEVDINNIIRSICINTIHTSLIDAMFRTVESLSTHQFDWLRRIAKPYWYERYSHKNTFINIGPSADHPELDLEEVRADIQYLLQNVTQLDAMDVNVIDEIKNLKCMWNNMSRFELDGNCQFCFNNKF